MASASQKSGSYLDGQMLIAMPSLQEGPFARSLVYLCAHREDGAMGIIVNQSAATVKFPELLVQLDIVKESESILLP
ncbi:MAG TPA: YqgE/AlgH family protein, partial [Roseiarcus sp.]|nr:YqgE/AlgH family protein [Roseiarcus sp.]